MKTVNKERLAELATRLCKLDYEGIEQELAGLDDDSLVELLNGRSRKVGDTAWSVLRLRKGRKAQLVVRAILADRFTNRDGKVRATNFLHSFGRKCPETVQAYFHILDDRNEEVAGNALFGIVFFQDRANIPALEQKRRVLPKGSCLRKQLDKAIVALQQQDPFLYSPYYRAGPEWQLDKKRFGDKVD